MLDNDAKSLDAKSLDAKFRDANSKDGLAPISARHAKLLFADWKAAPAIILAVSGGPDSIALMWLVARWRATQKRGPRLIAVTVDHGLRPEAAREAREVKALARTLDLPHRTLRWTGSKPRTGLPAAAREARYRLLVQAARSCGATHILTAHTRDDQAETLLMRMARGSGLAGLAAMARQSEREGIVLARPFLHISKSQLLATLSKAKLGFALDPSNRDLSFTRPRFRALMPALAAEGCDSRNLSRLAARLARANAALEVLADGAERFLALKDRGGTCPIDVSVFNGNTFGAKTFNAKTLDAKTLDAESLGARSSDARTKTVEAQTFDFEAFAAMSEEIRLRLLLRIINRVGHEGPAELGKVEALLSALDQAGAENAAKGRIRLKRTLAGALVSLIGERIRIEPAPPRRKPAN
jgi:tRNA(Ile)-lysidine synthase